MEKRKITAWILMPKDKKRKLKPSREYKYAYISWTKKDLKSAGKIDDRFVPTKVIVTEA